MKDTGVTLIELVIVVSIISILAVAMGFSYEGWHAKYKVESEVKTIYSDLMAARSEALQGGLDYFADFPDGNSYRIWQDTKPDPDGDGILETSGTNKDDLRPDFVNDGMKSVGYTVSWSSSPAISLADAGIMFDRRGLMTFFDKTGTVTVPTPSSPATISLASTVNPDYDCILISNTRIALGQMSGGTCNEK